jgi:hypothetical protein
VKLHTIRTAPGDTAVLVGRLQLNRDGGRVVLTLHAWCPWCRKEHVHGWPDWDEPMARVGHRVTHCDYPQPVRFSDYFIGLDPAWRKHNEAVLAEARAWRDARARRPT